MQCDITNAHCLFLPTWAVQAETGRDTHVCHLRNMYLIYWAMFWKCSHLVWFGGHQDLFPMCSPQPSFYSSNIIPIHIWFSYANGQRQVPPDILVFRTGQQYHNCGRIGNPPTIRHNCHVDLIVWVITFWGWNVWVIVISGLNEGGRNIKAPLQS